MSRIVIWGAGALGERVAEIGSARGPVIAVTATTARHAALEALGAEPCLPEDAPPLRTSDRLLLAVPGSDRQYEVLQRLSVEPAPDRVVAISTIGIYGQPSGHVDEDTPLGRDPHARRAFRFEQSVRAWGGPGTVVLRMGGLYEPGRGPYAALARKGETRLGPPDRTLALTHYDDAAAATARALTIPDPEDTYVVVTSPCPSRLAFYEAACARLGIPLVPFEAPTGLEPAWYDTERMADDLLADPAWPDWHAALG